jgi:hypothetical protein
MSAYFKVDITSAEEEAQYVAKFLKILNSLGEHASSYLFQKGVVLGDQSYMDYNRQLGDNRFRESIINTLLRPSDKNADNDTYCLVAILLFNMSKEASQLFLEIQTRPDQTGASSGIIALSHLMALIDRATAFLNLPSVNDKSYWRLMTLQPAPVPTPTTATPPALQPSAQSAAPKSNTPPAPAVDNKPVVEKPVVEKPVVKKPVVKKPVLKTSSAAPPSVETSSRIPELSPIQPGKTTPKVHSAKSASGASSPAKASTPAAKNKPPVTTKNTAATRKEKPAASKPGEAASDPQKPEGPLKVMVRRIAEEIHDNSYEAIIEALKDETFMKDLYYSPNNPISVKITEVNTKERVVYLIKQKRGAPEPVTFRLIRKLVTELQ